MLRPWHFSQGHGTACPSRDGLWATSLLSATTRSSTKVVIRHITVSDAGGQCETKHHLSWTRKRVVAAHYKKDDLLHRCTSSSDISGYHADFHGTAWSEQGRGLAWHVWINARHGNSKVAAREQHAVCESALILDDEMFGSLIWSNIFIMGFSFLMTKVDQHGPNLWFWHS